MKMISLRKNLLFWVLPLVLALIAFSLSRLNTARVAECRLLDARFKIRGPLPVTETPFQIVAIDDQTFQSLQCKWPFAGSMYAHLIKNLNRAGAKLIVFDVEFTEPNTLYPGEDSLFAAAVREAGNVILAGKIAYTFSNLLEEPYAAAVPPIPVLEQTGAPWGIVNEITDPDDFTRRYLLYLPLGEQLKLSLGLEVLRAMRQIPDTAKIHHLDKICRFGDLEIPLYDEQSFLINYYGPAGSFPAISFSSVLDDSAFDLGPEYDSNYMERFLMRSRSVQTTRIANPFQGKIVLIGVSAEELHDNKNTPFYDYEGTPRKTPGVEVHANALQTILDGSFIQRVSPQVVLLYCILLAYAIFLLVGFRKPLLGLFLSVMFSIAVLTVALGAFSQWNLWIDLVAPLGTIALAYLGATLYHYLQERREKTRIREMFSHYVPDQVVSELIRNPQLLKLGGERRRLTILFADIESFTTVSEKMAPESLVDLLNEYMTAMTSVILAEGGIIDKYEGDLIMAEFGAPVRFEDHALRACRSALKMQETLDELRSKWIVEGKPPLYSRIGVNTGDVIVGNMGSRDLFDYTVLGDAVNLSSRLENANKIYKTNILISQSTRDELPDEYVTRALGDLRVRGRAETVRLHELIAAHKSHLPPDKQRLLELYQQGWSHFESRKWAEAADCFEQALDLDPQDHPARMLLARSLHFESNPPKDEWNGVFTFEER